MKQHQADYFDINGNPPPKEIFFDVTLENINRISKDALRLAIQRQFNKQFSKNAWSLLIRSIIFVCFIFTPFI